MEAVSADVEGPKKDVCSYAADPGGFKYES